MYVPHAIHELEITFEVELHHDPEATAADLNIFRDACEILVDILSNPDMNELSVVTLCLRCAPTSDDDSVRGSLESEDFSEYNKVWKEVVVGAPGSLHNRASFVSEVEY